MEAPFLLLLFEALLPLLVPSAGRPPAANASAAPTVRVTVGVLLPVRNLSYPWAWPRVAPALSLALEALQPQLSFAGLAVQNASAEDSACYSAVALLKATELKLNHDPDVLLELGCHYYRDDLSEVLADYWQLPLFRAGFYQKRRYFTPGSVYLGPVGPGLMVAEALLHRHFNWTFRPVIVFRREIEDLEYYMFLLESEEYEAEARQYYAHIHYYEEPGEAVRFIQAEGRVVYIGESLEMLHQIMRQAHAQNMTNGDYVFLFLDIFGKSLRAVGHREARKPWQSNETQDTGSLQEAFQTVLVFTAHEPQTPEYRRFQSQLILRAQKDFGVTLNDSLENLVAGYFHDGLLLYLRALIETLREGGTKRNTSRILENMRNLKIQGVTGNVSINSKNDREMDFNLWAMKDVDSGEYQVVAHYIASENRIDWLGPILWKKGRPPLDNPPCVFDKDDPSCGPGEIVRVDC